MEEPAAGFGFHCRSPGISSLQFSYLDVTIDCFHPSRSICFARNPAESVSIFFPFPILLVWVFSKVPMLLKLAAEHWSISCNMTSLEGLAMNVFKGWSSLVNSSTLVCAVGRPGFWAAPSP